MDPLADVLDLARVSGVLMASVRARAPWGLDLPESNGASFHAVTSGTAWLMADGRAPVQLMPGDLVLLPAGAPHRLASDPDAACRPFDRALKRELLGTDGVLALDGPGAATTIVCAGHSYDLEAGPMLMALLPDVLHVPGDPVDGRDVAALIELLAREVGRADPGTDVAAARLIDLLLVAAIRRWMRQRPAEEPLRPSWLAALQDPVAAQVLGLLHERPAEAWTLERLAAEVNLSRATLARRFGEAVGQPPLTYLTRWRMQVAADRLRRTADPVAVVGRAVGYTSEYAFNRAFARDRGRPPGRYRREAQPSSS